MTVAVKHRALVLQRAKYTPGGHKVLEHAMHVGGGWLGQDQSAGFSAGIFGEMNMDVVQELQAISNFATANGVAVAAWLLWLTKRQGKTTFEDTFARVYLELAARFPTKALLGEPLTHKEYCEAFDEFHYIDLCYTQVFLHQENRISEKTWKHWHDGIKAKLSRPVFKRVWSEIAGANGELVELRKEFPPEPMSNKTACNK